MNVKNHMFNFETGDNNEVERLNLKAQEELLKAAQERRKEVINLAYEAVRLFLKRDQVIIKSLGESADEEPSTISLYVLEDFVAAPFQANDEPIRTFSLLFQPKDEVWSRGDKLRVHVVAGEFSLSDPELENLPVPNEIYTERIDDRGDVLARHIISAAGIAAYIGAGDTPEGEQLLEADAFEERAAAISRLRVDTGLPVITRLHEDMVNMKVVPQRVFIPGTDSSFDY